MFASLSNFWSSKFKHFVDQLAASFVLHSPLSKSQNQLICKFCIFEIMYLGGGGFLVLRGDLHYFTLGVQNGFIDTLDYRLSDLCYLRFP